MSKGGKSTSTSTPQLPPWLTEQFNDSIKGVNQFTEPLLAGGYNPSADTVAGQGMIRGWAGSPNPFATQDFGVGVDYQRQQHGDVYGGPISAAMMGEVGDISAKTGADYRGLYTDPYMKEVVDTSLADYDAGVGQNFNAMKAQYGASGAFGGSRHGVAEGQFMGDAARGRGSLAAGLRSNAFQFGVNAGMQDAGRALSASQSNQSTQLQRAMTQAAMNQQTNMFNAGQRQSANIFNTGMTENQNQFWGDSQLRAQMHNSGNIIQNKALMDNAALSRASALMGSGSGQDAIPWQALQARLAALGAANPLIGGQTVTKDNGGGVMGAIGGLGTLAFGLGSLGWNPLGKK